MRRISRILMAVTIAAGVIGLTGCPEENGGGNGLTCWMQQTSQVEDGVTITDASIYKFYDDGRVTFVVESTFSATEWSAQLRAWVTGTYAIADGNMTLDFGQAACEEVAAKICSRGSYSLSRARDLTDEIFQMQQTVFLLTQQSMVLPYSVEGNIMHLDGVAYAPFQDNYSYVDPTWLLCQ